ncbi:MAG: hypothetical protein Q8P95_00230 [bacterium]|nr:hypothetical protein [bacterium]
MIKVLFSHLCEKAFLSQNGNLNVIGIFENIMAPQFPIVFPQLSIVTALQGNAGEHKQEIKIVNSASGEQLLQPISLNISIKESTKPIQNMRIIGDINNLSIKEPGDYEVQIFLNGEKVYAIPFSAGKTVKPIPQGR